MHGLSETLFARFVYDDFMIFPAWQKYIAHGSTMIGMVIGAWISILSLLAICLYPITLQRLEQLREIANDPS